MHLRLICGCGSHVCCVIFCKFRTSEVHSALEIFHFDGFSDLPGCCNSFDKGISNDFIFYDGNEFGGCFGCCFKNSFNSFNALQSRKLSIVGTGCAASLDVTKCCDPSIQFEFVGQQVFYFVRGDFIQLQVMGTLRNYDNCFPLSELPMLKMIQRVSRIEPGQCSPF